MTNDFKTKITNDLEESIVNMANTIIAIALQGYVVNNTKYCNLNNAMIVHRLLKDYISFDTTRQEHITNLYNSL